LAALCGPAWAQFTKLAATADGSQLYFISALRLRDVPGQNDFPKVFRIIEDGTIELFAQHDKDSGYPTAFNVSTSDDGRTVATTWRKSCTANQPCLQQFQYEVRGVHAVSLRPGIAALSRNGRFLLEWLNNAPNDRIIDLDSGQVVTIPAGDILSRVIGASRHPLADDGSAVFQYGRDGVLFRNGKIQQSFDSGFPGNYLEIDQSGRWVLYLASAGSVLADLNNGTVSTLPISAGEMSNDGMRFLGSASQSATFYDRVTGEARTFAGYGERLLAGSGQFAFLYAENGSLVRVNWNTSPNKFAAKVLIAASPYLFVDIAGAPVPGSAKAVACWLMPNVSPYWNGRPIPVLQRDASTMWFQIPWDAEPGDTRIEFRTAGGPFEGPALPLTLERYAPRFFMSSEYDSYVQPIAQTWHENWSGQVSERSQARPGEIVHLFMTGLGPVSPTPATGEPGPFAPFARTVNPAPCEGEVLYSGIAPGLIGIYQVDIRLPANPTGIPAGPDTVDYQLVCAPLITSVPIKLR
jgi:uncharacterized protein (TIGR03437 family)